MAKGASKGSPKSSDSQRKRPIEQVPGATKFQIKYSGTSVSGLSGIVPYQHKLSGKGR
jgi:hypothetical protein